MRTFPKDTDDWKDAKALKAPSWMLEALKLNPEYVFWGPHEDYMSNKGEGWDSQVIKNTWKEFGPWELDDYNEIVNFYFEILRDNVDCPFCGGSGYHPDAQWVSESWYRHRSPFTRATEQERLIAVGMHEKFGSPMPVEIHGRGAFPSEETLRKYKPEFRAFCEAMRNGDGFWNDKITQDEVIALVKADRFWDWTREWSKEKGWQDKPGGPLAHVPTADEINAAQHKPGLSGHDAINRSIVVKARCKRFGLPVRCPDCEGTGRVWTAPEPTLGLVLWVLHPRKGASRGVEIRDIKQKELPKVLNWLQEAAKRNTQRFEKIIKTIA